MKLPWTQDNITRALEAVARVTGTTAKQIIGRQRTDEIARARRTVWFIMRQHFEPTSLTRIATSFGKQRNHTTVLSGSRWIESQLKLDRELRLTYFNACEDLEIEPLELAPLEKPFRLRIQMTPKAEELLRAEQRKLELRRSTWRPDPPVCTRRGRWRDRPAIEAAPEPEPYRISRIAYTP